MSCIQSAVPCVEPYWVGRKRPAPSVLACHSRGSLRSMSAQGGIMDFEQPGPGSFATPTADAAAALMPGIQARDPAALGQLYDLTAGRLFALASTILRSREDAEEIVCDVFTQAWNEADRYEPGRATVVGWLTMICRSRALDRLRQRRQLGSSVELAEADSVADPAPGPDALLALIEQGTRVHAALARLPEDRRELIALAFLRGLSHQEIAELKNLPLGTVKSHVRRGLLQLRDDLDALRDGGKELA